MLPPAEYDLPMTHRSGAGFQFVGNAAASRRLRAAHPMLKAATLQQLAASEREERAMSLALLEVSRPTRPDSNYSYFALKRTTS